MINIKQASDIALEQFDQLFLDQGYTRKVLEEVELSQTGTHWLVSIGYEVAPSGSLGLDMMERRFKMFMIEAESGALVSVKSQIRL